MPKSTSIYMDFASSFSPNPGSIHELGVKAKRQLEDARERVARVLSARPNEVIFTSGGTESNNLALQGLVSATSGKTFSQVLGSPGSHPRPDHSKKSYPLPHVITTNIEHPSVLETCKALERRKLAEVTFVPVEKNGIVDPKKIKKAIKPNTVLVSVMYANNEIGTIEPLQEIAKEIRHYKKVSKRSSIFFHTDAVQAANYLSLSVEKLGVDLLSLSGAKIEGAGRVGVLYKKRGVPLEAIMHGGNQEMGLRAGTENLPAIIEFSKALESVQKISAKESARLEKLKNYFTKKIKELDETIILNGDDKERLPNIVNITVPKIPSDLLVIELSARGVMSASKSACKEGDGKDSHVILALRAKGDGLSAKALASAGSLRFSFGKNTSKKELDYAIAALGQILKKLKIWYN